MLKMTYAGNRHYYDRTRNKKICSAAVFHELIQNVGGEYKQTTLPQVTSTTHGQLEKQSKMT